MSSIGCQRHEPELFYGIILDGELVPKYAIYGFMVEGELRQMKVVKDVRGLTADQICALSPPEFNKLPDHRN